MVFQHIHNDANISLDSFFLKCNLVIRINSHTFTDQSLRTKFCCFLHAHFLLMEIWTLRATFNRLLFWSVPVSLSCRCSRRVHEPLLPALFDSSLSSTHS